MKICPNCRDENDDSSNFCRRCRAPFDTPGKATCPRGHIIDPTWSECPYCKAEQAGPSPDPYAGMAPPRSKTVVEAPGQNIGMPPPMSMSPTMAMPPPSMPPPPSLSGRPQPMGPGPGAPMPPMPGPMPPMPGAAAPPPVPGAPFGAPPPMQPPVPPPQQPEAAPRRKTVFIPPPDEGAAEVAQPGPSSPAPQPGQISQSRRTPDRRIVGVLVTYSWKPEGQVFAVREGRNLIGRGTECEVSIPDDSTLSNVNSHITYRKSFVIGDMVSMSGTDLNGIPIEEQFVPLPNYATIRTGSTQWTFMAIQPAPASASASAGESPEKT
jgi:hypothetical protein